MSNDKSPDSALAEYRKWRRRCWLSFFSFLPLLLVLITLLELLDLPPHSKLTYDLALAAGFCVALWAMATVGMAIRVALCRCPRCGKRFAWGGIAMGGLWPGTYCQHCGLSADK